MTAEIFPLGSQTMRSWSTTSSKYRWSTVLALVGLTQALLTLHCSVGLAPV